MYKVRKFMTIGFGIKQNANVNCGIIHYSANNVAFRQLPSGQIQSDSFEYSDKKKNRSKNWLYGMGGFIAAGASVFAFLKYKRRPQKIKQFNEHIDFREFKTVDEAKQFAKETFGINLEVGDSLQAAKFINNRLINYNNRMKGSIVVPKKIKLKQGMKTADGQNVSMAWSNWGELYINEGISDKLKTNNPNDFVRLSHDFFHELGHANHQSVCKDYEKMGTLSELKQLSIKDTHYFDEFQKDINNNKIVKEFCSSYALTSPAEFVAETFADKIANKSIPKEVEILYKKYGGRDVPPKKS